MATIRDVARASGVSVATVSRVFNEGVRVSDATRRRVTTAADRLGYWPSGTARSLITNRTHALGVLLPDLHGEFFSEVIRASTWPPAGAGFTCWSRATRPRRRICCPRCARFAGGSTVSSS
jgi:hypothetical protein